MLNYILIAGGVVIGVAGYYFHQKNEKGKNSLGMMQLTAMITYAGFSMIIIGGAKLSTDFFVSIMGETGRTVKNVIQVILFLAGAEKLLKPAFEDQLHKDEEEQDKKITPHGTKKRK